MSPPSARQNPRAEAAADVANRLHSAAIHLLRRLRREDDAAGLSAPQLSALSVIVFSGPVTLGELARAEQVRPPTITRVVAGLESAGLVTREQDTNDRRVVRVRATPDGKRLLQSGRRRRVAVLAHDLEALTPREFASLRRALASIERIGRLTR